jgi:hypothetical protein
MPEYLAPAWEAFRGQAERVEKARSALLSCLPVGRVDPAPVPVGLKTLETELRAVSAEIDAWRVDEVEQQWCACRASIDEAFSGLGKAHHVAETSGELEELLDAVGGVVEPLDAWAEAERAWLRLRERR